MMSVRIVIRKNKFTSLSGYTCIITKWCLKTKKDQKVRGLLLFLNVKKKKNVTLLENLYLFFIKCLNVIVWKWQTEVKYSRFSWLPASLWVVQKTIIQHFPLKNIIKLVAMNSVGGRQASDQSYFYADSYKKLWFVQGVTYEIATPAYFVWYLTQGECYVRINYASRLKVKDYVTTVDSMFVVFLLTNLTA